MRDKSDSPDQLAILALLQFSLMGEWVHPPNQVANICATRVIPKESQQSNPSDQLPNVSSTTGIPNERPYGSSTLASLCFILQQLFQMREE